MILLSQLDYRHWRFRLLLVLLLETVFAFAFIVYKKSLLYAQPFLLTALRCLFAGTVLLGYQFFKDRKNFYISKDIVWLIILASILNIYITNAYELWGLNYVTAAKGAFIYNLSPFVAIFMSYLFLNERMSKQKWIGLLVGFFGFIPILFTHSPGEVNIANYGFLSLAEIALIAAAIATASGWVFVKKLVYQKKYPIIMTNGTTIFLAGLISLLQSYYFENWDIPEANILPIVSTTVAGAILGFFVGYNLYIYLLKKYSNTFMSFAGLSTPFITALLGWIFLGETVNYIFFISGFLVLTGLVIFYKSEVV